MRVFFSPLLFPIRRHCSSILFLFLYFSLNRLLARVLRFRHRRLRRRRNRLLYLLSSIKEMYSRNGVRHNMYLHRCLYTLLLLILLLCFFVIERFEIAFFSVELHVLLMWEVLISVGGYGKNSRPGTYFFMLRLTMNRI